MILKERKFILESGFIHIQIKKKTNFFNFCGFVPNWYKYKK